MKKIDRSKEVASRDAHYVDKEELYNAYVQWYAEIKAASEAGKDRPEPPRFLQESIIKICNKFASKHNFSGYTFKEEMIGDAIENIVRYLDRFDTEKYSNPFGYLSLVAERAFIRRIQKERKQAYVKHQLVSNSSILDAVQRQSHDDSDYSISFIETLQANLNPDLERHYKVTKKERKSKKKPEFDVEDMFSTGEDVDPALMELVETFVEVDDENLD